MHLWGARHAPSCQSRPPIRLKGGRCGKPLGIVGPRQSLFFHLTLDLRRVQSRQILPRSAATRWLKEAIGWVPNDPIVSVRLSQAPMQPFSCSIPRHIDMPEAAFSRCRSTFITLPETVGEGRKGDHDQQSIFGLSV